MQIPSLFQSKIFLMLVLILLISVGSLEFKQWQQRRAVNQEIESLMAQERELQQKNKDLESSLNFLTSDEYREKIARQQLNLKKDGEIVVNFPKPELAQAGNGTAPSAKSNPLKWWDYLFSIN